MTKLESYMLESEFLATRFYAEVNGHEADADLKRALEEMRFFSQEVRILGAYPAYRFCKIPGLHTTPTDDVVSAPRMS